MSTEIASWMTAKTFSPQLIITSSAAELVIEAVRNEFVRVGYKVKEATSARTRLRHYDWFSIAAGSWARTEVVLSVTFDSVLVEVTRGAEDRSGRKKGQRALNAAVASLRGQGVELAVGPWHRAPEAG